LHRVVLLQTLFRFFKELFFKVIVWAALFPSQNTITNREQPVSRREEERADGENGTLTYSFKPRDTIAWCYCQRAISKITVFRHGQPVCTSEGNE